MSDPGGSRGDGPDDGRDVKPGGSADEERRGAWVKVRKGGRFSFHVVLTLAAVVVCVAGEALGNVVFRSGHDIAARVGNAALFGLVVGNLLAWWLWSKEDGTS